MTLEKYTLDNGQIYVDFDCHNGKVIQICDRKRDIQLVGDHRLSENFRLLVPLEDWRGHFIYGRDQKLQQVNKVSPHKWELVWGPLVSTRGTFDIQVKMNVEIQHESIHFNIEIENRTDHLIEEVLSPAIGGLCNFEQEDDWVLHYVQGSGKGGEFDLYKTYPGTYLGPKHPVWIHNYESMPWLDIYDKKRRRGVYIGNHDKEARYSSFYTQFCPGVSQVDHRWPSREEISSETPIGLTIGSLAFPFLKGQKTYEGPPIVVHFHDGIWYEAAKYYRQWFQSVYPIPKKDTWLTEEDAWQTTIISWPDDTINYRFSDLPRLAREALSCGIRVLQIDGWDVGGIDRSYPHYTPDPRLGTWDDLRNAIAECQKMGVRILLFSNLHWAHIETDWYREELHQYAVQDPRGYAKNSMGWEFHTALGMNNDCETRMVIMNPRHARFQEIILDQLSNIVKLGADGTQMDKLQSGAQKIMGACIDYHPAFEEERDSSIMKGVIDTVNQFLTKAREVNPEFCMASESHWDRFTQFSDAAYARFFEERHLPTFAAVFPEVRQTSCISGPADYDLVNNSIMYGHIINIEASCIHGSVADIPDFAPYVAEALRIRRSMKDVLWHSRLVEPTMVQINANEAVKFSVHRSRQKDNQFVLVVTNNSRNPHQVQISIDQVSEAVIIQPFEERAATKIPVTLQIPAMRFAVIRWESAIN